MAFTNEQKKIKMPAAMAVLNNTLRVYDNLWNYGICGIIVYIFMEF